jgi:Saxitoxin biosynthesis operon protein SxtJ
MSATHEDFRDHTSRRSPSERSFGCVFTAAFLVFGLSPLRRHQPIRLWCLTIAAALVCVTLVKPSLLRIPNRIWNGLGMMLGKVVNPIVMGLLFYLVFTPCAAILRCLGKDLLNLSIDRETSSYWIPLEAAERTSDMTNQF